MKAALAAAVLLLATACSDATGIERTARVRTDASVYTLPGGGPAPSPAVTVGFTVRNTGMESISLANCGEGVAAELQRYETGIWMTVAAIQCPMFAIYVPIVLAPGGVAEGEVAVAEAGRYRLRVEVVEKDGAEFSASALSPDFEVRSLMD